MRRAAAWLGCTEGQVWTLLLGFVLAVVVLGGGLPAVLSHEAPERASATPVSLGEDGGLAAGPVADGPSGEPSGGLLGGLLTPPPPAPLAGPDDLVAELPGAGLDEAFSAGETPLRVASAGWATILPLAGELAQVASVIDLGYSALTLVPFTLPFPLPPNPLPDPTVPATGMPVAMKLGVVEKLSYLTVTGTDSVLRLRLIDGNLLTQQSVGAAKVLVCPLTESGWSTKVHQPMASAPARDCTRGVPLLPGADGTWSADLGAFPDRTTSAGFALVPQGQGLATFQVVFATAL